MKAEEKYRRLLDSLGADLLLDELMRALDEDTRNENLDYIAKAHDIDLENPEYSVNFNDE